MTSKNSTISVSLSREAADEIERLRNEHLKALDQRNEARREILRLLENNHLIESGSVPTTMFDEQAEKQRRNWIGL